MNNIPGSHQALVLFVLDTFGPSVVTLRRYEADIGKYENNALIEKIKK